MAEYKLFEGAVPYVSTAEFHADRPRAPHLEQAGHQERLHLAAGLVHRAAESCGGASVSDLGCGDGGLLSLVQKDDQVLGAWGYDFCPANVAGWRERDVVAQALDVFGADWEQVEFGTVVVMTEVLEHLADPHGVLNCLRDTGAARLVCSSPWNENPQQHDACHAWAWDLEGYASMIESAGWTIERHQQAGLFQVVLAR
jgi:SAM-dependent methyltransferase